MRVNVHFYSYLRDLTGCAQVVEELPGGSTLAELRARLDRRFAPLAGWGGATLWAVGLEYQPPAYVLLEGDEVSLFPPVQGG